MEYRQKQKVLHLVGGLNYCLFSIPLGMIMDDIKIDYIFQLEV